MKKIEKRRVLVALGGNALAEDGKLELSEQFLTTEKAVKHLVDFVDHYELIVTHGNGPQSGLMLLQQEAGARENHPSLSLNSINAATQGTIGYMIENCFVNELGKRNIPMAPITLVTQVLVDKDDPAMKNPTKPIGKFYSESDAKYLMEKKDWQMKEDSGRGWRRVVASPKPQKVLNADMIEKLLSMGAIVIAAGGGGIPVYKTAEGESKGVDAVIDKDLTSALLANEVHADLLLILTAVDEVCVNFGKPNETALRGVSLHGIKFLLKNGQFPPGSMGPKIQAAINFIENGGKEVIITSLEKASDALINGIGGTRIMC